MDHAAGRAAPVHLDGKPWNRVKRPWVLHRCWAQSWGSIGPFAMVERCPCGGVRIDHHGPWLNRNWYNRFGRRDFLWGGGPPAIEKAAGDREISILRELQTALQKGTSS